MTSDYTKHIKNSEMWESASWIHFETLTFILVMFQWNRSYFTISPTWISLNSKRNSKHRKESRNWLQNEVMKSLNHRETRDSPVHLSDVCTYHVLAFLALASSRHVVSYVLPGERCYKKNSQGRNPYTSIYHIPHLGKFGKSSISNIACRLVGGIYDWIPGRVFQNPSSFRFIIFWTLLFSGVSIWRLNSMNSTPFQGIVYTKWSFSEALEFVFSVGVSPSPQKQRRG